MYLEDFWTYITGFMFLFGIPLKDRAQSNRHSYRTRSRASHHRSKTCSNLRPIAATTAGKERDEEARSCDPSTLRLCHFLFSSGNYPRPFFFISFTFTPSLIEYLSPVFRSMYCFDAIRVSIFNTHRIFYPSIYDRWFPCCCWFSAAAFATPRILISIICSFWWSTNRSLNLIPDQCSEPRRWNGVFLVASVICWVIIHLRGENRFRVSVSWLQW